MKISSVLPAVRRIFIIWDDGGYNVNGVGEISILSKKRDFPAFGSLPLNGSHSSNCLSSLYQPGKPGKIFNKNSSKEIESFQCSLVAQSYIFYKKRLIGQ